MTVCVGGPLKVSCQAFKSHVVSTAKHQHGQSELDVVLTWQIGLPSYDLTEDVLEKWTLNKYYLVSNLGYLFAFVCVYY